MAALVDTLRERAVRFSLLSFLLWIVRIGAVALAVWGTLVTLSSGVFTAAQWKDFLIFGLAQGSVYALIALGYSMVYGVLRFINFAHGEVFMSGSMIGFFVADSMAQSGFWDSSPIAALGIVLLASMTTSTLLAVILERIAYRPLRDSPRLVPLITSLGMSFALQNIFRGLFGAGIKTYPVSPLLDGFITLGGINLIHKSQALVIGTALIFMLGLYLFVERTKTGKAMRAVAEDKEIASLMGIDVDRIIVITFAVGGLLAGVAGVLYAQVFRQVNFFTGFNPGIKAFTAAVLGGVGNIVGAMLGGLVLGLVESFGPSIVLAGLGIPSPHQLKDAVAFVVLVLVLIFRPSGILGERLSREKA